MKRKFFDTDISRFAGLLTQQSRVLKFAVENQNLIFSQAELLGMIQPIRTILKTPMAELFDRLVATQQLNNFAAFYTPPQENLPEILTTTNLTLDLKQFQNGHTLGSIPVLRNKILLNLTTTLRKDRNSGEFSVSAIDNFQNGFVRGQLVAGYHDLDNWIDPVTQSYIVRSYSMILSSLIARFYNLSLIEQKNVLLYFAYFMSQLLTPDMGDNNKPPIFFRLGNQIANRAELENFLEEAIPELGAGVNIRELCTVIAKHGPDKMHNFNYEVLSAMTNNLGPDILSSRIAIEYPPYWCYHLVLALSGTAKIPLVYQLKNQRLQQEGSSTFLRNLFSCEIMSLSSPLR